MVEQENANLFQDYPTPADAQEKSAATLTAYALLTIIAALSIFLAGLWS